MAEDEDSFPPDSDTMCNICFAEFLDADDLIMHFNQVHKNSGVRCRFCPSLFSDLDSYSLHIRDSHLIDLKYCKICKKLFTNYDEMRKHESKHTQSVYKNQLKCSQCQFVVDKRAVLQNHEFVMHDNDFDGVFIDNCMPYLTSHLCFNVIPFIYSLGHDWKYICSWCRYCSKDAKDYINHLKENCCRVIVCNSCCNMYSAKRELAEHLNSCNESSLSKSDVKPKTVCPKCQQAVLPTKFNKHFQECKPITCGICDLKLDSVSAMSLHQTENHPMAVSMTVCQFCQREFVGSVRLQKHIDRSHKKDLHLYKYKCVHCENVVFKHPKKLFGHIFSTHTDKSPYSCNICNETFRVRKRFTFHIKLKHNSKGFVEFDKNYHVHFTDKKSENPFQPKSLFADEEDDKNTECGTDIDNALNEAQTDAPTDAPTDIQTDVQTDIEDHRKVSKKPLKIRIKEEKKALETVNQATVDKIDKEEKVEEKPKKRKYTKRIEKRYSKIALSDGDTDESDDEPLSKVKRKYRKNRHSFTCNICNKYCYTYQNYNFHVATHNKNETKKCVKCSMKFLSKSKLDSHMKTAHSSSKLTEHLKNLLERKRKGSGHTPVDVPKSVKFLQTIKKVEEEPVKCSASIKQVNEKLSVQNFIENFTPDEGNKKKCEIQMSVSVKLVDSFVPTKPPSIKMTKFVAKPIPKNIKLAMPVKFRQPITSEHARVIVKMVQNYQRNNQAQVNHVDQTYTDDDDLGNDYVDNDNYSAEKNETVPEVAQEVMLESQEQALKPLTQRVLLPQIPNVNPTDIKIAHLLPNAPYYKITNLKDILNLPEKSETPKPEPEVKITLPSGKKLVNVNPLAHLIGDKPVEELIGTKPKNYYKKKSGNYESAIAKALSKLESYPPTRPKTKRKQKEKNLKGQKKSVEKCVEEPSASASVTET